MVPIYKLDKLPRIQRLRKIAKFFNMAEKRLSEYLIANKDTENIRCIFTTNELSFFADAAKLLLKDEIFTEEAKNITEQALVMFENAFNSNYQYSAFLRSLNKIKHLLFTATGKEQADWDFTISEGILDAKKRKVFKGMQVYLEDIRSPFNVGSIFRTAESFGAERIILSPFCADPRHKRAERTAMGCIDIIPWERQELFKDKEPLTLPLPVFALETGGIPINEFHFPVQGILIAGSEELGVSPRALEAADASLGRVSIPIYGAKASLNVSTAFGIAMQAWSQKLSAVEAS